ncbi:GNAT family N-acetyltransferase [Thermoproteota archaeon]
MQIKKIPLGECEKIKQVFDKVLLDPFDKDIFLEKMGNKKHLILGAFDGDKIVGFKAGYERGEFYTWVGGVLEEYRRKGIASQLANEQEKWAKEQGFKKVWFKTYNNFKPMIIFALKRGFNIVRSEYNEKRKKIVIFLDKDL